MASYYFQEDSEESSSPIEEAAPPPRVVNNDLSKGDRDRDLEVLLQDTGPALSPRNSGRSSSLNASGPAGTLHPESHSPSSQLPSPNSELSPDPAAMNGTISPNTSNPSNDVSETQAVVANLKMPIPPPKYLVEDAKTLAIVIEDSQQLSRSDLEGCLLQNLFRSVAALKSETIDVLHGSTDKHLPWAEDPPHDQKLTTSNMRLVPQTRVFYINKQYRTVFLVDVSSSVLTVDSGGTKIVMGQVMETLSKCLTGLSEKFSCPGMKEDFVQTDIHITVIAECSQFASNVHTGEILSNFPTMRILLQDAVLTESNLPSVLRVLRHQLSQFQSKLAKFRSDLRSARESLGYSLAVEDAVDDENAEMDLEDDISHRKSWGVGLSGANLSYTLTAGLFALGMMAEGASPSMALITDGVVKSNLLHGSSILRRLMELDVSCSIIQLGGREVSIPSCNWGFIQDTEILRFVTEATLGKFMYSQDCSPIDYFARSHGPAAARVAPNTYHRAFLIRELCLLKPRPGLDDFDDRDDSISYSLANFPWDPKSSPEPIKMMQTACKEYLLNIPVEKLVGARSRQGFRIKGVSVAPDRERPSMERYMITMTLAWLPNVTVQYKIKGPMSSAGLSTNYFDRFESPKIEIDIIAYQAFAIHFLNSQHAPVSANHSVYAKVFRLHRYIVNLSDSDVALRGLSFSHATANQALWTQRAKSKERARRTGIQGMTVLDQDKDDLSVYLSRFSEQWAGFAKDADYQFSRCWYSEFEFDALLSVPPPAFLPTALDTDHSLIRYNETLDTTVERIREYFQQSWASFVTGDVFVKTCQSPEKTQTTTKSTWFCELRLFTEPSVSILKVQLRFFEVPLALRRRIAKDIQVRLTNFQVTMAEQDIKTKSEADTLQAKILECRRPLHRLMMRHIIYEAPQGQTSETAADDFHTHVSEPIGEESVMRSYLLHKHWGWKDQVRDYAYLTENNLMASQDLAFQFLCAQRLSEGFLLASVLPNRVVFCKEIELSKPQGSLLRTQYCALQYLIFRSSVTGELVTEIWMEPITDSLRKNVFRRVKSDIIVVDRLILSRLATFEAIHTIGRLRLRPPVLPQSDDGFMYPWLFDPSSLLRQQRFITLAYEAPRKCSLGKVSNQGSENELHRKCMHTLGLTTSSSTGENTQPLIVSSTVARDLYMSRHANMSSTSLHQVALEVEAAPTPGESDLMSEYKEQIRELCCEDRDLAILHLYMEKSLSQLADGEIMAGGEDDACSQFFMDIKMSIKDSPEIRQALMAFHCAHSFQDIRCFVKIPNPRVFLLAIIPKLGSVIAHISKLRSLPPKQQNAQATELARHDFLSCLVFECMRSKPLTGDYSEYSVSTMDISTTSFDIRPGTLNQRSPAPSQSLFLIQPLMFEAVNDRLKNRTRLWESTTNLSDTINIAFSHSFAKTIYASLIEGHLVDKEDLKKACQICTRTTVDINITGFLNTLEQGRRDGSLSDRDEAADIRERFSNVLRYSFNISPVPASEHVYFYRPPLRKSTPKSTKVKSRKRSPSVSRSGSIDADMDDALAEVIESAERPFFLQLECSFQKPLTPPADLDQANMRPSVTFPTTELPLSYLYKEEDGKEQDYAPSKIGFESRPVDSADGTIAILHLVILSLPQAEDYSGPTLKSIESDSKISIDSGQLGGIRTLQYQFPTLDSAQIEAIADTESRLEWLLKEEIMHGLLSVSPITVDILNLVESQLKTKNGFVNFPTSMTLPLTFVKQRRGYDIFMQELGRANMYPFELHQCGDFFCLMEGDSPDEGNTDNNATNSMSGSPTTQENDGAENEDLPSLSGACHDDDSSMAPPSDLCHGLGIVILPKPKPLSVKPSPESSRIDLSSQKRPPVKKREFWLILVPKETYVQMYFFSKSLSEGECNRIVDHVRRSISNLCIKVNQLTLLQSLNETRNCSKYLVPNDDLDPNADSGSGSDYDDSEDLSQDDEAIVTGGSRSGEEISDARKFKPGEFACPLVYRAAWPLHWRVKPGQATKSVAHSILYPFAVQNRRNFYVVESIDDHDPTKKIVVFLRLSEIEIHPEHETEDGKGPHLNVGNSASRGDDTSSVIAVDPGLDEGSSHANSPRPSPTASPGSRVTAPPVIRTETRELAIEVYGVEPPGKNVTGELFSMLESKFYNSVVLSVVSTFLSRNSTLKLTQADVDFILPVDRMEPSRQILDIPPFINVPYAFMMYLKQNLCLYLSPLTGSDKVNALSRHYHAQFGRPSLSDRVHDRAGQAHQLQIGDFSFFYNAVQGRAPTPMEALVGIGVAGVCLTVLGQNNRPVMEVGYQEGEYDKEVIQKYFDTFPHGSERETSKGKYKLMIEVWAQGNVNATALLDAINKSFRQSLCDDIIETSIAQGLCPSARDRRNDVDETDGEPLIGERIQKNFIEPSFLVLQHAHHWKNPAVQSLQLEYSMPPWIMDSFLLELDEILTDVSVHFSPLLIRSMSDSNRYKEYKASSGTRKSYGGDMTNIRFILIGGIQDLSDGSSSSYYGRRTSMGSDRTHSRRSSLAESSSLQHSHKTSTHSSQQLPKRQLEDVKMYPNAVTTSGHDEVMLTRNCFVVITADGFGLQAYTYNWGKIYHEFVFSAIEKVVRWHRDRMRLLDNVLLQKMGLFHHVPSILSQPAAPSTSAPALPVNSTAPSTLSSNLMQGLFRGVPPQTSPHLGTNLRIGHAESVASTPNLTKSTSPKSQAVTIGTSDTTNLASLVEDQFPTRARVPGTSGASIYGSDDNRAEIAKMSSSTMSLLARPSPPNSSNPQSNASEQSPPVPSAITSGLDVDQILRDFYLEPLESPRDMDQIQDEVQRHGKPFLETYNYHTKNAEDQQNAYNVYQKWSRRYRDRKGAPHALHENMNTGDLAIMLRSSRLLHFCRTPLLFTESSSPFSMMSHLASGNSPPTAGTGMSASSANPASRGGEVRTADGTGASTKDAICTDPVAKWYSALAETFMREYSQYLASVGMQLLMYGNSKFDKPLETSQADELSFMSKFTVSQHLSVASPAAFLFKSLQGGSIMCEVRLQGMFVCVTLYTLNRRYGRVTVAAPGFATAEANKQSLRAFTEQCARFKDRIHVNSFVYDFHLRYVLKILKESSRMAPLPINGPAVGTVPGADIPMGAGGTKQEESGDSSFESSPAIPLPFSFDLLDVLHQFLQYHSRPAAYSRNRVYRGVYRTNVSPGESELPGHLFDYVIKNPHRYGFQPIYYQNRPKGCYVSGKDLSTAFGGSGFSPIFMKAPGGSVSTGNMFSRSTGDHQRAVTSDGTMPSVGVKIAGPGSASGSASGSSRTGLGINTEHPTKPFGPHARHSSHESGLSGKRASRRMTMGRSHTTIKESSILEDEGVEYVLVISDGEQDSMGITVHYYLLILREDDIVKKLEEKHGPLVGPKGRLLAASQNNLMMRDATVAGNLHATGSGSLPLDHSMDERSNRITSQLSAATQSSLGDRETSADPQLLSQLKLSPEPELNDAEHQPSNAYSSGDRLMDATELQERITQRCVLADVVRAAELRLEKMLKQAAQFFDRDSLWEMLVQGKIGGSAIGLAGSTGSLLGTAAYTNNSTPYSPGTVLSTETSDYMSYNSAAHRLANRHPNIATTGASELGFADILALGQRFHSTPLEEMEPEFRSIITAPGIDWNEMVTFLGRYYSRWSREFMEYDENNLSGTMGATLRSGLQPLDSASGINAHSPMNRRGSVARTTKPLDPKAERAKRHLVIFNPHNRDLLVHFVIIVNPNNVATVTGSGGVGGTASMSTTATPSLSSSKRTSAGDLNAKFNNIGATTNFDPNASSVNDSSNNQRDVESVSGSSVMRLKVPSQSHSQLQSLLMSSTASASQRPPPQQTRSHSQLLNSSHLLTLQQSQGQQYYHASHAPPMFTRAAFSETSSRVSSVTSIARAATLAVTKVANRLHQTATRRYDSTTQSGASSRAPSVIEEPDAQSIRASSVTGSKSGRTPITGKSTSLRVGAVGSGISGSNSFQNSGGQGFKTGTGSESRLGARRQSRQRRTRRSGKIDGDGEEEGMSGDEGLEFVEEEDYDEDSAGRNDSFEQSENDDGSNSDEGSSDGMEDVEDRGNYGAAAHGDEDGDDMEEDGFNKDEGEQVRVYSVSREPKNGFNAVESEHVGDIIRTMSYWLWRAQK